MLAFIQYILDDGKNNYQPLLISLYSRFTKEQLLRMSLNIEKMEKNQRIQGTLSNVEKEVEVMSGLRIEGCRGIKILNDKREERVEISHVRKSFFNENNGFNQNQE